MTEYEKADLDSAQFDRLVDLIDVLGTHLTIYLTLISAYIVVAYIVGAKLTRLQVSLVSVLYFAATLFEALLIVALVRGSVHMLSYLGEIDRSVGDTLIANMGGQYLGLMVLIAGLIMPLWFMYSVRKNAKLGSK